MTAPSKKHEEIVNSMNSIKKGEIIKKGWRGKRNSYFPDIRTIKEDIEIQMINRGDLKNKSKKMNKNDKKNNRKKVLVVGIYDEAFNLFDEVWVNADDKSLVKIGG